MENLYLALWIDLSIESCWEGPLEATLTDFDQRVIDTFPVIYETIKENGYVITKMLHRKL